jgi:hypothetical protein
LSSGDQLFCSAEVTQLQRLSAAINWRLLLLLICPL